MKSPSIRARPVFDGYIFQYGRGIPDIDAIPVPFRGRTGHPVLVGIAAIAVVFFRGKHDSRIFGPFSMQDSVGPQSGAGSKLDDHARLDSKRVRTVQLDIIFNPEHTVLPGGVPVDIAGDFRNREGRFIDPGVVVDIIADLIPLSVDIGGRMKRSAVVSPVVELRIHYGTGGRVVQHTVLGIRGDAVVLNLRLDRTDLDNMDADGSVADFVIGDRRFGVAVHEDARIVRVDAVRADRRTRIHRDPDSAGGIIDDRRVRQLEIAEHIREEPVAVVIADHQAVEIRVGRPQVHAMSAAVTDNRVGKGDPERAGVVKDVAFGTSAAGVFDRGIVEVGADIRLVDKRDAVPVARRRRRRIRGKEDAVGRPLSVCHQSALNDEARVGLEADSDGRVDRQHSPFGDDHGIADRHRGARPRGIAVDRPTDLGVGVRRGEEEG